MGVRSRIWLFPGSTRISRFFKPLRGVRSCRFGLLTPESLPPRRSVFKFVRPANGVRSDRLLPRSSRLSSCVKPASGVRSVS